MLKIAKNERIPKRPGLELNLFSDKIFLKEIDNFRHRRKFSRFVKVKPFIDYLSSSKKRKDFSEFCKELEAFRCNILGMNESRFYKIVVEFILTPNNRSYYNPNHLFGCDGSFEAEEFRTRIYEIMACISAIIGVDNEQEMLEFINELSGMNNRVEVGGILYKSKDWFCIEAIRQQIVVHRKWTVEQAIARMKIFYRHRIKKVYPEILLQDMIKGEFDTISFNNEKKFKPKQKNIRAIEKEDWFAEWKERLPE